MNTFTILYIITLVIGGFVIFKINRSHKKKVDELQNEIHKLKHINGLEKYEIKL